VAALTAMEEENLPRQAAEKGAYLMEKLRKIESPLIREVRGLGLMVGVELKQRVAPYLKALQERRIVALNAGLTVIRLLPPLVITYEQLDRVVAALTEVVSHDLAE
jgi:acetylornithine/LysW-gamma-L-lysine aminotransferase